MDRVIADRLLQRQHLLVRTGPCFLTQSLRRVEVATVQHVCHLARVFSWLLLHVTWHLDATDDHGRVAEGGGVDTRRPPALSSHPGTWVVLLRGGLHHSGQFRLPLAWQRDHLADLKAGKDFHRLRVTVLNRFAARFLLRIVEVSTQPRVLHKLRCGIFGRRRERGDVALQLLAQRPHLSLQALNVTDLAHHGAVRLELGEGLLDKPNRIIEPIHGQHVDGHVVARLKLRNQRVCAGRGQPGNRMGVQRRCPLHYGVADVVDAAAPRTPGQLRVLARSQIDMGLAIELDHLLQHDRARRHVDAQRKRFGGEDHLDQTAYKELLDDVLKRWQQTCVVGGKATHPSGAQLFEVEHFKVFAGNAFHAVVDNLLDLGALLRSRQFLAGTQALEQCAVAAGAGKDEHDRGQHVLALQYGDDLRAPNRTHFVLAASTATAGTRTEPTALLEISAPLIGVAGLDTLDSVLEGAVHPTVHARFKQREHLAPHHHVLAKRNRAVLRDDHLCMAANGRQPLAELLGVRHRRRKTDEAHRVTQVEDDLLPHRTTVPICQKVDLIHHHMGQSIQLW